MNVKTLIAAITLILAACTAIYFWAEWEKARSRPFRDMPRAQVITPASPPKQETEKGFSYNPISVAGYRPSTIIVCR